MECSFCEFEYGVSKATESTEYAGEYLIINELRPVFNSAGSSSGVIHLTRVLNLDETELYCKANYDVKYCPKCGRALE